MPPLTAARANDPLDGVGIVVDKRVDPEILNDLRDCRVWRADDRHVRQCGVLVTEPGDLDAPIAFVFNGANGTCAATWQTAVEAAHRIATEPELIDRLDRVACLDLRDRGRTYSRRPVPGWCYGLRLSPELPDQGELAAADWEPVEWCPWCPVRMAVAVEQYARLVLRVGTAGADLPYNAVVACDADDLRGRTAGELLNRPGNPHAFMARARAAA